MIASDRVARLLCSCEMGAVHICKLNQVNPQVYLTDLLTRLVNGWPQSCIDELMPWQWTGAQIQ
jgi:transposase